MLIPLEKIIHHLNAHHIHVNGILHIGAHECEELPIYNSIGVKNEDIVWIDSYLPKVIESKNRGICGVYHATISDVDDKPVIFNVSNNIQSSSILELGTHSFYHPGIVYVEKIKQNTITIDTFFEKNGLNGSKYNFWSFDIQGAELLALQGGMQNIQYVDALYLEVNSSELYVDCAGIDELDNFLFTHGFKKVEMVMTEYTWGDALYLRI